MSAGPSDGARAATSDPTHPLAQTQGADAPVIQGDADCSAVVDLGDVSHLLKVEGEITDDPGCADEAGDVDCADGTTIVDGLWILRFVAGVPMATPGGCSAINTEVVIPKTSETLIAEALAAGDITFEQSLLSRGLALFDSPGLPEEFRSPIPDLDAATELFIEVELHTDELSQTTLDVLAPLMARPNDPMSIFSAASPSSSEAAAATWTSEPAAGGKALVWVQEGEATANATAADYAGKVTEVWNKFPGLMRYPIPDTPGAAAINPNSAIDFYFTDAGTVDPRFTACNPATNRCDLRGVDGFARVDDPFAGLTSSGFLMINTDSSGDYLTGVIAHELFHVSQFAYDRRESVWLKEATATWGEFKVLDKLSKDKESVHQYVEPFMHNLDKPLTSEADENEYGGWQFFLFASMLKGDGIVESIWQIAASAGVQGAEAVDHVFPFEENFDEFTVRNWNQDPIPIKYKDADSTFPADKPTRITQQLSGGTDALLEDPVSKLSTYYYDFTFLPDVRKVTFENTFVGVPKAHVWAIKKIGGVLQPPEDWTKDSKKVFCRNDPAQDLTALIIIVSNADMTTLLPAKNAKVDASAIDCVGWTGTVSYSFHSSTTFGQRDSSTTGTVLFEFADDPLTLDVIEYRAVYGSLVHSYTDHNPLPNACETNGTVGVADGSLKVYPANGHYFGNLETELAPDPDCLGGGTQGSAQVGSVTVGRFKLSTDGKTLEGDYTDAVQDEFGSYNYHYTWHLVKVVPPPPP